MTRALGWRGGDVPAQLYRVELFRAHGFTLYDLQWFGGHWVPDYSLVFPAVAATVGVTATVVVSAAVAAGCFAVLVAGRLPAPRAASVVFAVGVVVQVAIGQFDFLAGEAVGMACLVAVAARRWGWATLAAAATAAVAPLAAALVAVAVAACWWRAGPGGRRGPTATVLGAVVPLLGAAALFPSKGFMPYPFRDWFWEVAVAIGALIAARRHLVLRTGLLLYAVALTGAFVVRSPLGGNIGRAEDVAALPLAFGLWWGLRPLRLVALAVFVVPLTSSEWSPAVPAMTTDAASPFTTSAAYSPLAGWLAAQPGPAGRVEVVPTSTHYETSVLAPRFALARGWERQLDEADDPLFYRPGPLPPGAYRAWLRSLGVRWVALAATPLDQAGESEAALLRQGVPGLTPAWSGHGWRVWSVDGSTGIAPSGVTVVRAQDRRVDVVVARPGTFRLALRSSPHWQVSSGSATTAVAPGGWLDLHATSAGPVSLRLAWP